MRTRRQSALAGLIPLLAVLAGCNPYYLVESEFQSADSGLAQPEITTTETYRSGFDRKPVIALGAPDRCADNSSAETRGDFKGVAQILRTRCGVEMSELEMAFVRAGYKVVSWNAMRQIVIHEAHFTPIEAAGELGADVVFQVNSLERIQANLGSDLQWKRRFFESDRSGRRGPPIAVPESRAQSLESHVHRWEQSALPPNRMGATTNATVIDVKSGEAIWFYDGTVSEQFDSAVSLSQLFECSRRHTSFCLPRVSKGHAAPEPKRSEGAGAMTVSPRSMDAQDGIYFQLVRRVLEDMVNRFSTGTS